MKTLILLVLSMMGIVLSGCEHEHGEHHHGYYGAPAPYQYGTDGYYYHDWSHH